MPGTAGRWSRSSPFPSRLHWNGYALSHCWSPSARRRSRGNGSRVRFELKGLIATFHRPHPAKEAKPYQVRDVRTLLEQAGIRP